MGLLIRERMPLRLHASVQAPDGSRVRRWAADERKPEYSLAGLTFSSTAPGGYESASSTLARKIITDLPDLEEFSTVTIRGVGGQIAWQGRLEGSPRSWGDQSNVQPQLVGWQSHLDDDQSARMIPVDADRSRWQSGSVQREINLLTAGIDTDSPSSSTDQATGYPSVVTAITGPDTRKRVSEAWYDANGIDLGQLYFAWKRDGVLDNTDTNWSWQTYLLSDDIATTVDASGVLRAAGPGSGTLAATAAGRKWAMAQLFYNAAVPTSQTNTLYWTALAAYDNSGIPLQGAGDFQNAPGVLASDVIAYAVGKWAPKLTFTTGPGATIVPSTFVIPHLVFLDPGGTSVIVNAATAFELQDWFVWDGPTFWWYPRGTYGRNWRARVGPSQLQETGPSASRVYNGVLVTYSDVSGVTRSVGPVGSGASTEDASLSDPDPLNPATEAGLTRTAPLQMGTATAGMAIQVGAIFLAEQKILDTSGQATLAGHVEDDRGVLWPAWMVRAGDTISFVDASDPSPRRVIRAEWADDSRTCAVSLDAPPDGLQALLERLGVELAPLGFS